MGETIWPRGTLQLGKSEQMIHVHKIFILAVINKILKFKSCGLVTAPCKAECFIPAEYGLAYIARMACECYVLLEITELKRILPNIIVLRSQ